MIITKHIKVTTKFSTFYFYMNIFSIGYITVGKNNVKIATPEKALLDFLYLSSAKSLRFALLPKIEFPKKFNYDLCQKWINKFQTVVVEV
jgi:hypothetical protein